MNTSLRTLTLAAVLAAFAVTGCATTSMRASSQMEDGQFRQAAETYERLGSPEGELALANAVLYLASTAKSDAAYRAYNQARAFVSADESRPVPMHLRNAPTKLMKELGHGAGYRHAHDEVGAYAAGVHYFPEGLPEPSWYQPVDRGLEARIRERLAQLRELDRHA